MAKPLCKFIQQSYPGGDAQAEHCRAAEELSKLRKNALGRPLDKHDACLDTLLRYGTARHGTARPASGGRSPASGQGRERGRARGGGGRRKQRKKKRRRMWRKKKRRRRSTRKRRKKRTRRRVPPHQLSFSSASSILVTLGSDLGKTDSTINKVVK